MSNKWLVKKSNLSNPSVFTFVLYRGSATVFLRPFDDFILSKLFFAEFV